MNTQTILLGLALAGGGFFAFRELEKVRESGAAHGAAGAALGSAPRPGGTLPPGSVAPGDVAAQLDAVTRKNQVDTLRRDLARIQNDIDVLVVQAQSIKTRTPDAAFVSAVSARVWDDCRNGGAWLTQAARCNNGNMPPLVAAAVTKEWTARIALELQPVQAQLSRLNTEQLATVRNLQALGLTLAAGEVKNVSV